MTTLAETASTPEVGTPSSATSSPMDSPGTLYSPPTPLSPDSNNLGRNMTPTDNESSASSVDDPVTVPSSIGPAKRKPARRANTAERRATHNAVERQRRETLNGRFLDLATLLPNLATVRRPSKSAIVNSSIASLHAARRTRLLAARELRLLRSEADFLRRELNDWRARASLPLVDEPPRSQEFQVLINPQETDNGGSTEGLGEMGEEERKAYELALQDRDEDVMGDDGCDDSADINKTLTGPASAPVTGTAPNPLELFQRQQQQAQLGFSRNAAYNEVPPRAAFSISEPIIYEPSNHHNLHAHNDFAAQAQMDQEKLANPWPSQQADFWFAQMHSPPWAQQLPSSNQIEHNYMVNDGGDGRHANVIAPNNQYFLQQQQHKRFYTRSEQDDSSSAVSASSIGSVGSIDSNVVGSGIVRSPSSGGIGSDSYALNQINGRPASGHRKASYSLSFLGSNWAAQGAPAMVSVGGGAI